MNKHFDGHKVFQVECSVFEKRDHQTVMVTGSQNKNQSINTSQNISFVEKKKFILHHVSVQNSSTWPWRGQENKWEYIIHFPDYRMANPNTTGHNYCFAVQ